MEYLVTRIESEDELYHYGVKGMKWGVRRAQKKKYGMSEKQVLKAIKKARKRGSVNQKKVEQEYFNSLLSNKNYNEKLREFKKIGRELDDRSTYMEVITSKDRALTKRYNELNKELQAVERKTGAKYIEKFNDARLKDIGYSKSTEVGRKMLEEYGKTYRVSDDGTIEKGTSYSDGYIFKDYRWD